MRLYILTDIEGVAGVANWQIGRDNLPPAWPLVARADRGMPFRVLWLSGRAGVPLPAPGGDPQGAEKCAKGVQRPRPQPVPSDDPPHARSLR